MLLIRLLFWLALAVLLLPTDERQQARLYDAAAAAIERVASFCDRNGKVCAGAGELWGTFLKKAEFGAHLAIDLMSSPGRREQDFRALPEPGPARARPRPSSAVRGTLTPNDLAPAWRGASEPSMPRS